METHNLARSRLYRLSLLAAFLLPFGQPAASSAQVHPLIEEHVAPATVQVRASIRVTIDGEDVVDPKAAPLRRGTAFFISPDGLLATAYHVVDPNDIGEILGKRNEDAAAGLQSTRQELDGYEIYAGWNGALEHVYTASLILADRDADVALLRIDRFPDGTKVTSPPYIPHLSVNDPPAVLGGERLFAFGFPEELDQIELVEATVRSYNPERSEIRADASTLPGMSGGPVVNENGAVVALTRRLQLGFDAPSRTGDVGHLGVAVFSTADVAGRLQQGEAWSTPLTPPNLGPIDGSAIQDALLNQAAYDVTSGKGDFHFEADLVSPRVTASIGSPWTAVVMRASGPSASSFDGWTGCLVGITSMGERANLLMVMTFVGGPTRIEAVDSIPYLPLHEGGRIPVAVRFQSDAVWAVVNNQSFGPFGCPAWAGVGNIMLVPNHTGQPGIDQEVEFENLRIWELD
jgi:V8-like Glu-specific endopeptidase